MRGAATLHVGKVLVERHDGYSSLYLKAAWWSRGARYAQIDLKTDESDAADFFGASHYVEVNDQAFGRFGGIGSIRRDAGGIELALTYDLRDGAQALRIRLRRPTGEVLQFFEDLERAL